MKRSFGSIEEHPRGSEVYRLRVRINGRLVTILGGVPAHDGPAARDERFPDGRCVYFLRRGLLVKIGWSDDVAKRKRTIERASGDSLELVATFPGGQQMERLFHNAFRRYRQHGEWFLCTADLEDCINKLRKLEACKPAVAA